MNLYRELWTILLGYMRSRRAINYAAKQNAPGIPFARYGQQIAKRLLIRRLPGARGYLLTPVNITRYFEFDFALANLPERKGDCLDVSSPRLLSYYTIEKNLVRSVTILNPDTKDAQLTAKIALGLNMQNIVVKCGDVKELAFSDQTYDCIWSISVIEHISGDYDDTNAIQWMYNALNKGGRLILTLPVDRRFWEEYRGGQDPYGTQEKLQNDVYFFQRYYDPDSMYRRLFDPIGVVPVKMRWFGEKTPGHFQSYIQEWLNDGVKRTIEDAREIADHYQEFESWDSMSGVGVCGILIEK